MIKNKSAEVIADELEEVLSEVEKVIAAQKQVGSYDVEQICKVLEGRREVLMYYRTLYCKMS